MKKIIDLRVAQYAWKAGAIAVLITAILLPRLLSLGATLTVDEPLWQSRGDTFFQAFSVGNFSRTLVAGQPGVTTSWLVGLASFADSLRADQAAVAMMSSLLVLIIVYFAIRLWGFNWGILSGFLLALDPLLIGHSRLVHTDALLALFYLASVMSFLAGVLTLYARRSIIWRYVVISAVLGAAALLTKMFALVLLPTILIIGIVTTYGTKISWQNTIKLLALWGGVFVLTLYLLWPALWTNTFGVYNYLFDRVAIHSEGTRNEEVTSAWWYYARESAFRFTVITTLLLPATLLGLFKYRRDLMQRSVIWLLIAAMIYALSLNISADKSDRYILFSLITVAISSILGLRVIVAWMKTTWPKGATRTFILTALTIIGFLAADAIRIHPYYLAHHNQLYLVEENHKLGWGEGLEQAVAWVAEHDPNASIATYYPRVVDYFYNGEVTPFNHAENKDYLILYRSMMERGPNHIDTEVLKEYLYSKTKQPEKIITINNLPYAWIFKPN